MDNSVQFKLPQQQLLAHIYCTIFDQKFHSIEDISSKAGVRKSSVTLAIKKLNNLLEPHGLVVQKAILPHQQGKSIILRKKGEEL